MQPQARTGLVSRLTDRAAAIVGALKNYDWGVVDGLRPWACGQDTNPQAELWFGDHPSGDSQIIDLGEPLSSLTSGSAPLMVKIIACAKSLSIQVHPNEQQAQMGMSDFATNANSQVLVDSHGKDEMLLALSRFDLLAGFVAYETGYQILRDFGGTFDDAADDYVRGEIAEAIRKILTKPAHTIGRLVTMLPYALVQDLGAETVATKEPALVVAALMQRVRLYPGEAVHVPPGTVHAYLGGVGVEVMTTSDNVLRLGLTSKPTAVEAALSVANFEPVQEVPPQVIGGVRVFAPTKAPFALRDFSANGQRLGFEVPAAPYRVVLAIEGRCWVSVAGAQIECQTGEACVVVGEAAGQSRDILVETDGRAVAASYLSVAH
jgi:mannose-6-phosphate isomerase